VPVGDLRTCRIEIQKKFISRVKNTFSKALEAFTYPALESRCFQLSQASCRSQIFLYGRSGSVLHKRQATAQLIESVASNTTQGCLSKAHLLFFIFFRLYSLERTHYTLHILTKIFKIGMLFSISISRSN